MNISRHRFWRRVNANSHNRNIDKNDNSGDLTPKMPRPKFNVLLPDLLKYTQIKFSLGQIKTDITVSQTLRSGAHMNG